MKPSIFTYIIAGAMFIFAFYAVPMSWNQMMLHSGTSDSVLGNSAIGATFIDNVLCTNNSPACHTGDVLFDEGWRHDVAPDYALAFLWQGSDFGKINCGMPTATCMSYHGSWKQTYDDWYSIIAGPLYKGSGVVSVPQIVAKAGGPDAYAKNVMAAVKLWSSGTIGLPS
jgi:hypothetical protein